MGEFDFTDNLIALAQFRDSHEAAPARTHLEAAGIEVELEDLSASAQNSTSHSVELLVRQGDLRQARDVLADLLQPAEHEDDRPSYEDDYDANDWSGEDWSDEEKDYEEEDYNDNEDDHEEYSEEPAQTPPLTRAWRASLIGGLLLPCLVINFYSVWLILEHQLWRPQPGETRVNWRFPAALFFNLFGLFFFWLIVSRLNLSRLILG